MVKIGNYVFEMVEEFTYLGTLINDKNNRRKEKLRKFERYIVRNNARRKNRRWEIFKTQELRNTRYKNMLWTVFKCLNSLRVPKHSFKTDYTCVELHGFSDASNKAYGGCIYIRAVGLTYNDVSVNVLCAKSRVAPLKPVTIPTSELCSELTLAKLMKQTVKALGIHINRYAIWTDSSVVLGWLKSPLNRLKVFVANSLRDSRLCEKC